MTTLTGATRANGLQASRSVWRLVAQQAKIVVPFQEAGGVPFYCVHPVAGDVTSYDKLFALIDPQQSLYGIQVPRATMNGIYVQSIEAVARRYADAIIAHCPTGALMIGGYSAGAIIALEVAQLLQAGGREIRLLVAMDGAPLNSGAALRPWRLRYVAELIGNVPGWLASRTIQSWGPRDICHRFVERLVFRANGKAERRWRQTAPREHLGIVARLVGRSGWDADQVSFIRSLYDALHAYVPQRYEGRVLVFEMQVQPLLRMVQTRRIWMALATRCDCISVSSDHTSLLNGTNDTAALALHLNRVFAELRASDA